MMSSTLQELFTRHFNAFAKQQKCSNDQHHAAWSVKHCRTRELGGHVNSCPEGHYHSIAYNSCGHRSCPKCGWLERQQWIEATLKRFLPVPHHHIVITLPHEFIPLWRFNRAKFIALFFATTKDTLFELLQDPKYLGATPGLLAVLHTWNQKLEPHVHLHCIVTAGGLDQQGRWKTPKRKRLLPAKPLMLKFRGKFLHRIQQAVDRKELHDPNQTDWNKPRGPLRAKNWNLRIFQAYRRADGVAKYLGDYLRGGPIKESRILSVDDSHVRFRYRLPTRSGKLIKRDNDGKRTGKMKLPINAFIVRWLEHVPPRRLQTVRGYGLYGANQHSRIEEARTALGSETAPSEETPATWQDLCERAGFDAMTRCPTCGARLESHHPFGRGRSPPIAAFVYSQGRKAA